MTHRVLVADDEKSIRLTVCQALAPLKIEVDEAADGKEALRKLGGGDYDLVLVDLRMPEMDGIEMLKQMRSTGSATTAVVVTAYGTIDSAVEAMKLGAVDFVEKPFSPDELRSVVRGALERRLAAPEYDQCLEHARAEIERMHFAEAGPWVRRALALEPSRADAYNLLGVLEDLTNHPHQAQKYYRAALEIDPKHKAARDNLERSTTMGEGRGRIQLGDSPRRGRHRSVA